MRMVFTNHITDHACRFLVGFIPVVAQFRHGVENPPVHGFKSVPYIRQRPTHDHAHRVIEIGLTHFLL